MDIAERLPLLATVDVASLVSRINRDGYAFVPGFPGSGQLDRIRSFVADAIQKSNGEYTGFTGTDSLAGSGLDEIGQSFDFRDLAERIYQEGTGQPVSTQKFYQVLRCLAGKTSAAHSYFFHYDSYVLTILLPIQIPTGGQTGDLLMLPNMRRIRKTYLANVLDKVILDNRVSQFVLRRLIKAKILRVTRVKIVPGNLYFFWGYRSIHANEPCDPGQVRATALFHYANPHRGASMSMMPWKRKAPNAPV
ncbi:MAG: hypothetical protein ACRYFY_09065 [Janthinobacterium lividum]